MKLNAKNYAEPTPKKFRKIGDSILLASVLLQAAVMNLPVSENAALWINFSITCIGIAGKVLTNFAKEESI